MAGRLVRQERTVRESDPLLRDCGTDSAHGGETQHTLLLTCLAVLNDSLYGLVPYVSVVISS